MKKSILIFAIFMVCFHADGFSQIITTVAGNGSSGFFGDGVLATSTSLNSPHDVCVDDSGNVIIADWSNSRVRKVSAATGIITTIAGTGSPGFSGDGGLATAASLNGPGGVCLDDSGNIYIADGQNSRVRKITVATGIISTVAGTSGTSGYNGDSIPATSAKLRGPSDIFVDSFRNIYIADNSNHRIRKVTASTGLISTVAGNGISGFSGDGGPADSAKLYYPAGVCLDDSGNIYIADWTNHRIRKVSASTGIITTVVGNGVNFSLGDGGPATSASFTYSRSVYVDASGNIFIGDGNGPKVRKVTASTGIISTVAGNGTQGFSGDGGLATLAQLNDPYGVTLDISGNMYIVDQANQRIRKVTAAPSGIPVIPRFEASVFPNPNTGKFIIQFSAGAVLSGTIQIFDVLGKTIYSGILDHCSAQEIDISNNRKGIYFAQINDGHTVVSTRILIQ